MGCYITLPSNELSPIDFVIRKLDDWKNLKSIFLDIMSDKKMEKNPDLICEDDVWKSKNLCEDYSNILLSYEVSQVKFDLWHVKWIELNGYLYYFNTDPSKNSALITAE